MLRETGSTRLMAGEGPSGSGGPNDNVLRAVMSAVVGEYEILGEMGRGVAGTIMYLARELGTSILVVLRLDPALSGDGSVLSLVRELEPGIPAAGQSCSGCGAPSVGWGRFCAHCGADLIGGPDGSGAADNGSANAPESPAEITGAARRAAAGKYQIIGTMPRAGGRGAGAGLVHFAREIANGRLVALSLGHAAPHAGGDEQPSFRVTHVLQPLAFAGAGTAPPPGGSMPALDPPPVQPPRAQPTPHRAAPQAVLIPLDDALPDESLPPRPVRKAAPWWIAPTVVVVAAVVALAAFVKARASMPDGTDARLGSGGMGVTTLAAAAAAPPVTLPDSAHVRIEAALPDGAEITVNGRAVAGGSVALVPGEYVLAAAAPGYVSVSETLALEAGQTLIWTPPLAADVVARAAPAPKTRASSPAPASSAAEEPNDPEPESAPESCASAYNAKDWSNAATLCAAEARGGDVSAQRNLGVMYDRGVGVARDPAQAVVWLRRAASAGNRDAAYQLGAMYESGRGVDEDAAEAAAWYARAALLGDRDSQVKLGKAYEQGAGVPRNMAEAITWYRKAAAQGDAWAQNYIGFLYGNGKGVRHDDAEALRWFRKSAASGNAQAEYNVGFMYANGRGVERSDSEAVRWYRRAADHGYTEAVKELERRGVRR